MSEWKEYNLSDAVELITGFPFKGDKYEMSGKLKVVRGENVTLGTLRWDSEKYWNHSTEELEKYFLKTGDIVIGMDGSRVGKNRAIIREDELPLILAQRVARLRAKGNFDQKFIWYQIYSKRFIDYVDAIQTGTSIPHISPTLINDFEIIAPDYKEQKAISETISSLDDKIDLLHRQNKTLEQLAETLFRQWFVEEAEESWEVGKLGDVLELVYGKALKEEVRTGNAFPVIGSSGVVGYHSEYLVEGPGIVIGRKGTLGKVIYLFENFFPIDTTYFVKSKNKSMGLFYEYFLLKTMNFLEMNSDSAVPGLNRDIALRAEIKIPSEIKITEFNSYCSSLFQKTKSNTKQIHTLTQLRDTLLPKLMSGELRVNPN
jgi:type I restriction enzyme, S subunit